MAGRSQHSETFQLKVALEPIRGDLTIAELASKLEIHPTPGPKWRKQALDGLADVFSGRGRQVRDKAHESEIKELHDKIGRLTIENDFLSKAFGCRAALGGNL